MTFNKKETVYNVHQNVKHVLTSIFVLLVKVISEILPANQTVLVQEDTII
jgi:hypothetical protein